ncbi:MAG TPA: hypothetical protein DCZ41_00980 [Firmicutes bacterium]|nr:hypothetical protein [Bacillota bacterium]
MKKRALPLSLELFYPTLLIFAFLLTAIVTCAQFLYRHEVVAASDSNMSATSEQLLGTYDSYFDQVFSNSNAALEAYNEESQTEEISPNVRESFSMMMSLRKEITAMALFRVSDGKKLLAVGEESASFPDTAIGESWFQRTFENEENRLIPFLFLPEDANQSYRFTLSRYANYERDSSLDAVLRIDFSFQSIVDSLSETALGEGGYFVIYDKNYRSVYRSNASFDYKNGEETVLRNLIAGHGVYEIGESSYFVYASSISKTSWRLGVFLNRDSLEMAIGTFTLWSILSAVIGFLVFALLLFFVSRRLTRPLRVLSTQMQGIVSLNELPSLPFPSQGSKEVQELDRSFEAMFKRLEELNAHLLNEKEMQRQSELRALQNQINPHFLYNTLDSILALIEKGQNEKAGKMIVALSRFFRISISRGRNVIPLRDELEHARNYLLIQKLRFGDSFTYDFQIEEGFMDVPVIKLILQPLIENAIAHGLPSEGLGRILIAVKEKEGKLLLSVTDNGYGMSDESKQALWESLHKEGAPGKGVGLKNVYLRVRLAYGETADILIDSELDKGATFTLVIPLKGEPHA